MTSRRALYPHHHIEILVLDVGNNSPIHRTLNKYGSIESRNSAMVELEKILIIAVKMPLQKEVIFHSTIEELISLSQTAGGEVLKVVTQNRQHIHPATYIGSGKIIEIKNLIDELEIDLVISNDELSPGQLRNLSNHFNIRVIDRSQLILDIFAQRAKTKEGKLQVELAQLQYTLPRLRGQGIEMSRLAGGIGTRGPGETKLETDQRHIRRRIDEIKRRLELVVKQREQYRKRRKTNGIFQIAIVGYTNAGKSTIFNQITNSDSLAEDKLFATLDPLTRQIQLPSGFETLVTDTVGFLQKLPTSLIAAFRSTLEEVNEADFILHVVDGSHPDQEQHQETVYRILKDLDADTIPMLNVFNKKDLMDETFIPTHFPSVIISAFDKDDINKLILKTEEAIKDTWDSYRLTLEPSEAGLVNQLSRETIVVDQSFNDETNQYLISGYMQKDHPIQRLLKEK